MAYPSRPVVSHLAAMVTQLPRHVCDRFVAPLPRSPDRVWEARWSRVVQRGFVVYALVTLISIAIRQNNALMFAAVVWVIVAPLMIVLIQSVDVGLPAWVQRFIGVLVGICLVGLAVQVLILDDPLLVGAVAGLALTGPYVRKLLS